MCPPYAEWQSPRSGRVGIGGFDGSRGVITNLNGGSVTDPGSPIVSCTSCPTGVAGIEMASNLQAGIWTRGPGVLPITILQERFDV